MTRAQAKKSDKVYPLKVKVGEVPDLEGLPPERRAVNLHKLHDTLFCSPTEKFPKSRQVLVYFSCYTDIQSDELE